MTIKENAISRPASSAKSKIALDALAIIGFIALMAVCSWIKVPAIVPVTLQTFAVFLAVAVLGTKRGAIAVAGYVALGLAGAPVFAGFMGGPAYLLGASGGYIVGFVFSALATGAIMDRFGRKVVPMALAMLAGLAVCYAFGTVWFLTVSNAIAGGSMELGYVLSVCVTPFIIPDIIKIAFAIALSKLFFSVREAKRSARS